jgi:hypothetical protein
MFAPNSDIIQIMPAEGWEAYYDNWPTKEIIDVACFALHRNGEITAMVADYKSGKLIYAVKRPRFLRLVKLESKDYF